MKKFNFKAVAATLAIIATVSVATVCTASSYYDMQSISETKTDPVYEVKTEELRGLLDELRGKQPTVQLLDYLNDVIYSHVLQYDTTMVDTKFHLLLPDEVYVISERAFENCNILSIKIPATIGFIGTRAFANIKTLNEITIPGDPIMEEDVFKGCTNLKVIHACKHFCETYAEQYPSIKFAPTDGE